MNQIERKPVTGLKKFFFRAPLFLYRMGLGGLLGQRFLLLNHTGRKSGQPRQTVLEVVNHDKTNDTYFIASGFGKKSDWYLNILTHPKVEIQVGWRKMAVTAVPSPQNNPAKRWPITPAATPPPPKTWANSSATTSPPKRNIAPSAVTQFPSSP